MIRGIGVYESNSFDPYRNLAAEQFLLENMAEERCILYLWQNENTVVIGRNQNPWKECRTALLEEEGGHLARRLSGGGAVFHDLGNLNFTFLMPQADFDVDRQLTVIQKAVELCGLETERSGRNDVLVQGRKFSGNAFYKNGRQAYHHGTLLVNVDKDKLGRYLSPSKAKLQSKGVDSVRSRVANLQDYAPEITVPVLKQALIRAFAEVYGENVELLSENQLDQEKIDSLRQQYESWNWRFGQSVRFSISYEDRFPWGGIQLCLQVKNGIIDQAKVYTDAMDWTLAEAVETVLAGCEFQKDALLGRLTESTCEEVRQMAESVCQGLF